MAEITFEVPDHALQSLDTTSEAFASEVRLAAAMFWYGRADVTMGTAAAIAGLDLRDFMQALKAAQQNTFAFDMDEWQRELALVHERADPTHEHLAVSGD